MADYLPAYTGGVKPFTATTSASVTGGRVVAWSGNGTISHAGADSVHVCGVAAHDAGSGQRVTVWPMDNCIHELQASGAIAAQAGVVTAANGEVATAVIATAAAAGTLIGTAATTAAGTPLKLRVHGRR